LSAVSVDWFAAVVSPQFAGRPAPPLVAADPAAACRGSAAAPPQISRALAAVILYIFVPHGPVAQGIEQQPSKTRNYFLLGFHRAPPCTTVTVTYPL